MTVNELIKSNIYETVTLGNNTDAVITMPYACDLLSFAMSRAAQGSAWFTVMGNVNTIAVAVLTECACVILCDGAEPDEAALGKAQQQGVTVFKTALPIFEAALLLHDMLQSES